MTTLPKKRLFIECSQTFFNGGNGGIQRVVRNLANYGRTLSTDTVQVSPIVWTGMGFCLPLAKVKNKPYLLIRVKRKIQQLFYKTSKHTPGLLKKYIREFLSAILTLERRDALRKFVADMPYLFMSLTAFPAHFLFGKFVKFQPGDVVVMVDSTWRSDAMLDALFKAQCDGNVTVGVMLHDLFPLILPHTCEDITAKGYASWFEQVVPRADFFVANSESTRCSLATYLSDHKDLRPHPYPSGSFRLGAELDLVQVKEKPSRYLQPIWDAPGRAILCVGTIEPRKNHNYLLDAYDLMRAQGADISLVILGKAGWKNKDVLDRIRSHSDFGTRLLHFENATDRDLAEAIERADCLVCPSIAEGFGLPVVEGMMHGLKVFASDIKVFREIGGDNCDYFDLNDPSSLAELLAGWFDLLRSGKPVSDEMSFSWPDWKSSTREFIGLSLELAVQSQKASFELKR